MYKKHTLKTPLNTLQQDLWEIKREKAKMVDQNCKLRAKLNSQMKWKRIKRQNKDEEKETRDEKAVYRIAKVKAQNSELKNQICMQEKKIKEMNRKMQFYHECNKKNLKMELRLYKSMKKFQKQQKREYGSSEKIWREPQEKMEKKSVQLAQEKNEQLFYQVEQNQRKLKNLQKKNKIISKQVLDLINLKNELKRIQKSWEKGSKNL